MTTQSGFTQLPPELLMIVAEDLTIPDLRTFRLLGRLAKEIGDSLIFKAITYSPQERHKQAFLAVCNHARYRHYVKTVRYSVTTVFMPKDKTFIFMLDAGERKMCYAEKIELLEHAKYMTQMARETPVWQLVETLSFGLSQLQNIRSIEVVHDLPGRSGWFCELPWLSLASESHNTWERTLQLLWESNVVVEHFVLWQDLHSIVYSINKSGVRISEFSILHRSAGGTIDRSRTPILRTGFPNTTYIDILPYKMIFTNLVKLALVLDGSKSAFKILPELLRGAKSLEHLELDCHPTTGPDFLEPVAMDVIECAFMLKFSYEEGTNYKVAQSVIIPKLRTLSLSNFINDGWTLLEILKNHKSIESLTLQNVHWAVTSWSSEAWEGILDTIKTMNLKKAELDNISGFTRNISRGDTIDTVPQASKKYVTHVTPRHVHELWAALDLWQGCGAQTKTKRSMRSPKLILGRWLASQPLRDRIKKDRHELGKLIHEYINGGSDVNPLVGLEVHHQMNWQHDEIMSKILTRKRHA